MDNQNKELIISDDFKNLIMSSLDGFRILDASGYILEVNDAYCQLVGCEREQLIGVSIMEIEIHQKYALFSLHYEDMLKLGSAKYETKHIFNDGSLRYFEASEVFTQIHGGCLYAFIRDITDRKRAELALKKSEERIRNLLETIPDGVYKSTPKGKLLEVNPAMVKMLGYESKEELMALDIKKDLYFEESERDTILNHYENKHFDVYRLKKKDGSELWVEDSFKYIYDMNGDIAYHEGVIRDISERIHAEDAIRESEEKMRVILETIPYPIFAKNVDLVYIACNKAFEEYLGKNKNEIIGFNMYDIADKAIADIYKKADLEILENGLPQSYESVIKFNDGIYREVLFHKNIFKDAFGKNLGIVGLIEDISEKKKSEKALYESERRFKALIDNSYDAILLVSKDGVIKYQSPSASKIMGRELNYTVGTSVLDYMHSEDVPKIKNMLKLLLQEPNKIQHLVIRRADKNGEWRVLDCTIKNMLRDTAVNAVVINFQDITQRFNDETELANQLAFQQALIDSIPYAIFIKDASARFVGCNRAYEREFGTSRDYLKGKTVLDLEYLPEDERERFQKEDLAVIAETSRRSYELPITYADGVVHSTLYTVDGFRLNDGNPGGLIGLLVDITERKEAQEAILKISKIQSLILDNSSIGIALVRNRQFVWANPRLCELFQIPIDKINGESTRIIYPSETAYQSSGMAGYSTLAENEKIESVLQLKKGDGSLFWCRVIGNAIDINTPEEGSIWLFEDNSEKIANEEKIQKFIIELKDLNATKDKFFSIIAHDLKNPLGGFAAICEFIVSEYDNIAESEKKEFLLSLRESAVSVYSLLENLLEWSRSQRGAIQFDPQSHDLHLIVKYVVSVLEIQANNKKITINNNMPESSFAKFDANMVSTIMRNFISNSIKFSHIGGTININIKDYNEGFYQVSVEDNGMGMSEETLQKLFKIGETQSSLGTNKETGTGLGLILCKEFVEKHGGKIWAESEIGKGSTLIITIPKDNSN